jgi:hypothetical protein
MSSSALASLAPARTSLRAAVRWRALAGALAAATLLTTAAPEAGAAGWFTRGREALARSRPAQFIGRQADKMSKLVARRSARWQAKGELRAVREARMTLAANKKDDLIRVLKKGGMKAKAARTFVEQAERQGRGASFERPAAAALEALKAVDLSADATGVLQELNIALPKVATALRAAQTLHGVDQRKTDARVAARVGAIVKQLSTISRTLAQAALQEKDVEKATLALKLAAVAETTVAPLGSLMVDMPRHWMSVKRGQPVPRAMVAKPLFDQGALRELANLVLQSAQMEQPGLTARTASANYTTSLAAQFATANGGVSIGTFLEKREWRRFFRTASMTRARATALDRRVADHLNVVGPAVVALEKAINDGVAISQDNVALVTAAVNAPAGPLSRRLHAAIEKVLDEELVPVGVEHF